MKGWRMYALWIVVAALVFSLAVCQKKVEKEKTAEAPKAAEMSAVPEEAEAVKEAAEAMKEEKPMKETKPMEKEMKEKPAEAAAAPESKPMEEKAEMMKKEKPAEAAKAMSEEPITKDNAAAIIELEKGGRIVIEFYPKDAPNTVGNFIKLAKKGFYDGLTFHRVVPGFVVQGGCPLGNGTGDPGYKIKAEFNSQKHLTGTVAMARSAHPDSAGSQFYICLAPQPGLNGEYTVFGQTIEGMDLVQGIVKGDVMKKVTIVNKDSVKK